MKNIGIKNTEYGFVCLVSLVKKKEKKLVK